MDIKEKIKELKELGETVYSISRLNTVDECGKEYWLAYHKHLQGKQNIYGFTGTKIHKCLEDIQNDISVDLPNEVDKMLEEAKIVDLNFPSEKIEEKWKKNIISFAKNYKVPKYDKKETEKLFLINLDGNYLQGIIDLLIYNEDGTVSIVDYKTSSKFSNSELESKGRQLILYGLAMEELGYKVKSLAWNMIKYVEISYQLKNKKIKTTIAERGYIIDKLKNDITKELKSLGIYSDFEIETLVLEAIERNSFDNLPSQIKEKYTIKDYYCYYDFTEERKEETKSFIKAKINDIENFEDEEDWWEAKELTPYNTFYCKNLCGYSEECEEYQNFVERQKFYEEKRVERNIDEELSKFF